MPVKGGPNTVRSENTAKDRIFLVLRVFKGVYGLEGVQNQHIKNFLSINPTKNLKG